MDYLVGMTSVEVRVEEEGVGLRVKEERSWRGKGEVLTSPQEMRRLRVTCGAGQKREQWEKKLLQENGCPGSLRLKVRNLISLRQITQLCCHFKNFSGLVANIRKKVLHKVPIDSFLSSPYAYGCLKVKFQQACKNSLKVHASDLGTVLCKQERVALKHMSHECANTELHA